MPTAVANGVRGAGSSGDASIVAVLGHQLCLHLRTEGAGSRADGVAGRARARGGDPAPLPARPLPARLRRRASARRPSTRTSPTSRCSRSCWRSRSGAASATASAPLARGRWLWLAAGLFLAWLVRSRSRTAARTRRVRLAHARRDGGEVRRVRAARAGAAAADPADARPRAPALVARALERARDGRRAWRSSSARRSSSPEPSAGARRRSSRRRTSPRSPAPRCSSGSSRSRCRGSRLGRGARRGRDRRAASSGRPRRRDRVGARARDGARRARVVLVAAPRARRRAGSPSSPPAAAIVLVGAIAIRGSDLDAFVRFLGASPGKQASHPAKIQTYAHRTVLAWIGYEIWKDHPLLGVGWEGSAEPANFLPYVAAAKRKFSDVSPNAFPSAAADRRYGVQNVWLQALADLGVIGLALWLAVFAAAAWLAGSDGGPGRRGDGVHRPRLDRPARLAVDGAGLRRGHPARRVDVARVRAGRDTAGGRMSDDRLDPEPHLRAVRGAAAAARLAGVPAASPASRSSTSAAATARTSSCSRGAATDRRLRRARQRARRPARVDRRAAGRGRELRRRPLPPGARARAGPGRGGARAAPRRPARRPRARLDARHLPVPPEPRGPVALDTQRPRAAFPREWRLVVGLRARGGGDRRNRGHARRPSRRPALQEGARPRARPPGRRRS